MFDQDTGQVYRETVVSVTDDFWKGERKESIDHVKDYRHPRGAAPIAGMVTRVVFLNRAELTVEALRCLPFHDLGRQLWRGLKRDCKAKCPQLWLIFAAAYGRDAEMQSLAYHFISLIQNGPLLHQFSPTISLDASWITVLRLDDWSYTRKELVDLSKLSNLGLLKIGEPCRPELDEGVDDRVARAWGQAARDDGAFQHLYALMIAGTHRISECVIEYVSQLPSLSIFMASIRIPNYLSWGWSSGKDIGMQDTELTENFEEFADGWSSGKRIFMKSQCLALGIPFASSSGSAPPILEISAATTRRCYSLFSRPMHIYYRNGGGSTLASPTVLKREACSGNSPRKTKKRSVKPSNEKDLHASLVEFGMH